MPRQEINTEFNTFVGGILTEANPINYPKGYALDMENFEINTNGTLRRRWGLDVASSNGVNFTSPGSAKRSVVWDDGKNTILLAVASGNEQIHFYDLNNTSDASDVLHDHVSTITKTSGGQDRIIDMTVFKGYLIVLFSNVEKTYTPPSSSNIAYDTPVVRIFSQTGTLSAPVVTEVTSSTNEELVIRDRAGLNRNDYKERSGTLTDGRIYNLLNNGWNTTNYTQFNADLATYPSVLDSMNTGLDAATGAFTSTWVDLANTGTTSSASGRQLLNPFVTALARIETIETTTGVSITGSPTDYGTVTEGDSVISKAVGFAGRLFYATRQENSVGGVETKLFFSQVSDDPLDLLKCHTVNDQTSRDFNAILDTDGGVLDVSSIGGLVDLATMRDRLYLFATSGVYEVFSTKDIVTPTSLSLRKISDVTVAGRVGDTRSITTVEDTLYFMSQEGIYKVIYNPQSNEGDVISVSDKYIKTFIRDSFIPTLVTGYRSWYSPKDKIVSFKTTVPETGGSFYSIILNYNILLDSWTKTSFYNTGFTDIILLSDRFQDPNIGSPTDTRLQFLVANPAIAGVDYTFLSFNDNTFTDLGSYDYVYPTRPAFIQTGYINAGDSQRYKQASYIIPSFLRTEDGFTDDGNGNLTPTNESSCMISAWWDYAEDSTDVKANDPFEAYRLNRVYIPSGASDTFDYGQSVITTKNRLTGRGRALSLRFESTAGKDCRLLGWGLGFETNTKV